MSDYLLEIGVEEVPAKFMPSALKQLQNLCEKMLQERRLYYMNIKVMGTPRRLSLIIEGLAKKEDDLKEEVRGPAKRAAFDVQGQPTKAAQGFARSQGVRVEELLVKETGNGEYIFAIREVAGRDAKEVLPELIPHLITELSFPKPMRWGYGEQKFARPLRWIVSLLDGEIIPFNFADVKVDRVTRGHRFLGKEHISIDTPQTYEAQLQENFVIVDQNKRKQICWQQIQETARQDGGYVQPDDELLEEVTYLLEWPTALMGSFGADYLSMPEEVIITPMREHQRYFPVRDNEARLMNRFVTVRNGNENFLDVVRSGNEKVLNARLADARFFWEEDQKIKLEQYLPRLEKIVFQESLGTMAQKTHRIKMLVQYMVQELSLENKTGMMALRSAELCKADLVTNMVYEFPELQGIMGRYYAEKSGEDTRIAQAIDEHYQPRFAGDQLPASLEGALVSIADKIDTIAGCFALGIEPTGSQDPYALRRQAMGICLIIAGHRLELRLTDIISKALSEYREVIASLETDGRIFNKIMDFFQLRLKNILTEEGHRYDVVDAVLNTDFNSIQDTISRARALTNNKEKKDFVELVTAFTRAYNLAKKAESDAIDLSILTDEAEKTLYESVQRINVEVQKLIKIHNHEDAVREMCFLSKPINSFFDSVMVMVEDEGIKNNRLGLLRRVVEVTSKVGDLSKIVL